jgi:hypothetical protein
MSMAVRLLVLAVCAIAVIAPSRLDAQVGDSLTRLTQAVANVSNFRLEQPDQQAQMQSYTTNMNKDLGVIADSTKTRKVSDSFRKSLDSNTDALGSVKEGVAPSRVLVIVGTVAGDIRIKAGFVQQVRGDIDDVIVTATTRSGSEIRNGYEVWYVPAAHADNKSRHMRFPDISSPTTQPLSAGNYMMWSQQGSSTGERTPVEVGSGGRRAMPVDLPIPTSAGRKE